MKYAGFLSLCQCMNDLCGQEIAGTVGMTITRGLAHLQVDFKHGNIAWIVLSTMVTVKTEIVLCVHVQGKLII